MDNGPVEFLVLGPLEVRAAGEAIELGGPRQRTVLAALLVRANTVATVEHLVNAVWESPPATPESNLRQYVSGLRKHLGVEAGRLVTRPGGYLLRVEPGELDLATFEQLACGGPEQLRQALALWRGRPLEGLTVGPALAAELVQLDERHHGVVTRYAEARFELGRHAEVVPELRHLTLTHPLREGLWVHLMTALHQSGRRADALAAYRQVRALLDRELGVPPSQELQEMHAHVLADPKTAPAAEAKAPARQLPPHVDHFTGRQDEVGEVVAVLARERAVLPVVTISGTPGVGKSALAVACAHQLAAAYGDGQLFVDLSGAAPHPREAGDVLARFLRDLGVPGIDIPASTEERSALFRDRVADRRILVVLDNAATDAQVRPLLPGSPSCGVIITSRRRLTGLDVSQRIQLDQLTTDAAVALLGNLAGAARVDRPVAARIVRCCGHLPLAIRIIGTKLRTLSHLDPVTIASRLEDQRQRLDELVGGDRAVRAGFLVSYEQLSADLRRAFRLLALLPGVDFTAWAAAAAFGSDLRTAERLLDELVEANLLECRSRERPRYRFYDLIKLLALERSADETDAGEREAALTRILERYLQLAQRADAALAFGGLHRFAVPPPASEVAALATRIAADAPRWFDDEQHSLVAAVRLAADLGRHQTVCRLSATLAAYFELRARWDELMWVSDLSLTSARAMGSEYWRAYAYFALGLAARERHDLEPAQRYFGQCLAALPGANDPRLEMVTNLAIAVGLRFLGDFDAARASFTRCLEQLSEMDEPRWVAYAQRELGILHRYRGEWAQAKLLLQAAADEFALLGDPRWEAACLRELGVVQRALGDNGRAMRTLRTTLDMFHTLGDVRREAATWRSLAYTHRALDDLVAARACCRLSGELFARTLDAHGAACTQVLDGEFLALSGKQAQALDQVRTALNTFRKLGDPRWTGKALLALGRLLSSAGMPDAAAGAWQEAREHLTRIGATEATEVPNLA